jgi:hypothetical protein
MHHIRDGQVASCSEGWYDITERKLADLALKKPTRSGTARSGAHCGKLANGVKAVQQREEVQVSRSSLQMQVVEENTQQ